MTKVTLHSFVVDVSLKKTSKTPRSYSDVTIKICRIVKEDAITFKIEAEGTDGSKVSLLYLIANIFKVFYLPMFISRVFYLEQ